VEVLSSEMWHVAASFSLLRMTAARYPEKPVPAMPPREGSGPGEKKVAPPPATSISGLAKGV